MSRYFFCRACSCTRRIISSRVTTLPRSARNAFHTSAGSFSRKGLRKAGWAEVIPDFPEVVGDPDGEGGKFVGGVVIGQSYENKPTSSSETERAHRPEIIYE